MPMKKATVILSAVLLAALLGCSGTMQGVIRDNAKKVLFTYSDSKITTADIQVVMPDGERFQGRLAKASFGSNANKSVSRVTIGSSSDFEEVETFTGNTEATLSGDMGNIMKCRFHITDTIIGLSSSGFGLCQTADGRVIDIFF
jgi:hypothetical protein